MLELVGVRLWGEGAHRTTRAAPFLYGLRSLPVTVPWPPPSRYRPRSVPFPRRPSLTRNPVPRDERAVAERARAAVGERTAGDVHRKGHAVGPGAVRQSQDRPFGGTEEAEVHILDGEG